MFNLWALLILIRGVIPFILALRRSRRWIFLILSLIALTLGSVFLITTSCRFARSQPGPGPGDHRGHRWFPLAG